MKKYILVLLIIHLVIPSKSQGVIFDSVSFNSALQFPVERTSFPDRYSLESYVPAKRFPQTGGTCVAMSLAMARTILFAIENNITDKDKITVYQMSPYFIYYLARDKTDHLCAKGLDIIHAAFKVKENGAAHMYQVEYKNHYPFTNDFLCPKKYDYYPPELINNLESALANRINEVYTTKSISGIKAALSNNLPVVLAMQIPKSFEQLKTGLWEPRQYENKLNAIGGHAVVAIAYDDNLFGGAIKIVNSWGDDWGNRGMAWIRYRDLPYWLDAGVILEPIQTRYNKEMGDLKVNEPLQTELKPSKFNIKHFNTNFKFDNKKLLQSFNNFFR